MERRLSEVVEKRRDVLIALVDAVPKPWGLTRIEVTADERRLAGAGRPLDPDDGSSSGLVENPKESGSGQPPIEAGFGQFGWQLNPPPHAGEATAILILP